MNFLHYIPYLIGTALFLATMCKQFYIIIYSPKNDPFIVTKIVFFVFNVLVLLTTWLLLKGYPDWAVVFFIAAGAIGAWVYFGGKSLTNATTS
jgi:O-antigen/teichoic acid export membrane protein